jgi:hypothetical protein
MKQIIIKTIVKINILAKPKCDIVTIMLTRMIITITNIKRRDINPSHTN